MPSCMESDDIGDLSFFSCQHCQWWNECVAALTMNEIPRAMFDKRKHLRGDAVVTLRGPGPYTNNAHSLDHFLFRQRSSRGIWYGCKNCDVDSPTRKTTSNFVDMRFNTTYIREVSRCHHQNVEATCFSCHKTRSFFIIVWTNQFVEHAVIKNWAAETRPLLGDWEEPRPPS